MTLEVNGFFPGEISPSATVGGCIEIFENAWPNWQNTIRSIETLASDSDSGIRWQRAETIGQGPFQNIRTNSLMPITYMSRTVNNPLVQNIHNQFYMLLLAATNSYAYRFGINEFLFHEDYNLLKYQTGQEYKAHYDGGTNIARAISALVYLNDDYEGGEIEFVNFNVKIKPQAGMMILFPSNYAYKHVAHPVLSGIKYNLVTWIRDRQL